MQHEKFEHQNIANTMENESSNSKMLQIHLQNAATSKEIVQKSQIPKTENHNSQNTSGPIEKIPLGSLFF